MLTSLLEKHTLFAQISRVGSQSAASAILWLLIVSLCDQRLRHGGTGLRQARSTGT